MPLEMPQTGDEAQRMLDDVNTATPGSMLPPVLLKIIPSSEIQLLNGAYSQMMQKTVYTALNTTGAFAEIFKAKMDLRNGNEKLVAVKIFRAAHISTNTEEKKNQYKNRLRREYGVWGTLDHPNILRLEGLVILWPDLPSPGLVSEYKPHGDLFNFAMINRNFDRLSMARGIACGLEYLHSKEVVHGDLTPSNVLVDADHASGLFFPLITDFGRSRVLERDGYTTKVGDAPVIVRPPELLELEEDEEPTNKSILSPASDIYSFSLLLLWLVTGLNAYTQEKLAIYMLPAMIIDKTNPLRPVPEKYPLLDGSYKFCWSLMQACWRHEKDDRISSRQAHAWLCKGSHDPTL